MGEQDVLRVSFEILSAWDEVISLGWRENVNLQQVRSVLEMESHEEKIQEIIARVRSPPSSSRSPCPAPSASVLEPR